MIVRTGVKHQQIKKAKNINTFFDYLLFLLQTAASVKDCFPNIDLANVIKKLEVMTNIPCHLIENVVESDEKIR